MQLRRKSCRPLLSPFAQKFGLVLICTSICFVMCVVESLNMFFIVVSIAVVRGIISDLWFVFPSLESFAFVATT